MSSDEPSVASTVSTAARRSLGWLAPTTTYRVWFGLVAVAGLGVCGIPLFNLLGYESAALFGVILGPAVVLLTLHAFRCDLAAGPLAEGPDASPLEGFAVLGLRHLALLGPPALALSANALRVKNCDFATGALFWLLIPVVSVVAGQTVGWAVAAAVPERRWLRNVAATTLIVLSGVSFGLHLALQPPIVGHQLFLGFFSGSIYDEALALPTSLVAYRVWNLAGIVVVLSAIEGLRRWRNARPVRWVVTMGVAGLIAFVAIAVERTELGIGIDRSYIQSELGGRLETEHFVIHYPERQRFLDQLDRLAEDHEFRYAEMREYFDTDPASDGKLHSYVYPNREVKGQLMGARRTLVAKIWLGEIHILWPSYGHHWLAHEMSHLFTAPFGAGPLRLSMQNGVGVNMGMVEGIATAADWPADDLTPHDAAAALRELEMAPKMRQIVGASGFWTKSSGRAYTVVGSFIRYLIDAYGIESFKKAYGRGAFRTAYGKPVGALIDEWKAFLDGRTLSDRRLETARFLYRRPSIFGKVCARTTAELRRRATIAAARGDVGTMRRLYDQLIELVPKHVDYRIEFARRLLDAGDLESSFDLTRRLLERDLPPVQRARLLQLQGDIRWHRDDPEAAGEAYRQCLEEGLPIDDRRLLRVKHRAVRDDQESVRSLAFEYLLADQSEAIELYAPMDWAHRWPDDPLADYLVGRRLWQHREWSDAEAHLREARRMIDDPALGAETKRMLGRSLYFQGEVEAAGRVFVALRGSKLSRYRVEAEEWLRRVEWRRQRGPAAGE